MRHTIKVILAVLAFIFVMGGIESCKLYVWKRAHPGAPTWTYFAGG